MTVVCVLMMIWIPFTLLSLYGYKSACTVSSYHVSTVRCNHVSSLQTITKNKIVDTDSSECYDDEKTSIFRTITSPTFELDDILSEDSIKNASIKYTYLCKLFPYVSEMDIRSITARLPLYLLIESSKFDIAIENIRKYLKNIDPSYVFLQRAAGLDVFLSFMSSTDDVTATTATDYGAMIPLRCREISQYIGKENNVDDYLRRVPQLIRPKYLYILQDAVDTFSDMGISKQNTLSIVKKWPGILNIEIKQNVKRINSILTKLAIDEMQLVHRSGKHSDNDGDGNGDVVGDGDSTDSLNSINSKKVFNTTIIVKNMMKQVPRVLIHDLNKRINILKAQYPAWQLYKIVQRNPRILTEKLHVLSAHYSKLVASFDDVDIDIDAFVNAYPTCLLRDPAVLRAMYDITVTSLPSCTPYDVLVRGVLIFNTGSATELRQRLVKVQKQFKKDIDELISIARDTSTGGGNVQVDTPIQYVDFNQIKTTTDALNAARILARSYAAEADAYDNSHISSYTDGSSGSSGDDDYEGSYIKSYNANDMYDMFELDDIAAKGSHFVDDSIVVPRSMFASINNSSSSDDVLKTVHMSFPESTSVYIPAELSFLLDPISSDDVVDIASTLDAASGVIDYAVVGSSSSSSSSSSSGSSTHVYNAEKKVLNVYESSDITRIIMGNLDTFTDNFPYFLIKLKQWIDEYGAHTAHLVLSASPVLVKKKPAAYRSTLKYLYGFIADLHSIDWGDAHQGSSGSGSNDMCSAEGHISSKLYKALRNNPKVLKLAPAAISARVADLQALFGVYHSIVEIQQLVTAVPLLLTESLSRISLRLYILQKMYHSSSGDSSMTNVQTTIRQYPWILTSLLSVLIRPLFIASIMDDSKGLTLSTIIQYGLLSSNTDIFIESLLKHGIASGDTIDVNGKYIEYLQSVLHNISMNTDASSATCAPTNAPSSSSSSQSYERVVCSKLNSMAALMNKDEKIDHQIHSVIDKFT